MAFLVETYSSDRGIQIGVEELFRPFSFGTNWQRIRIGIRAALSGNTTQAAMWNGPVMGLSTNALGSLGRNVTDCIFANFNPNQALTYSGTPPNVYYDNGGSTTNLAYQTVGNTTGNNASGWTIARMCISANPAALVSFFAFDVTKGVVGTNSYTFSMYAQSNTQILNNYTRAAFLTAMTTDGTPANTTASSASSGYCGLRTAKDWNYFFVGHRRSTPPMTIFDMAVARYT